VPRPQVPNCEKSELSEISPSPQTLALHPRAAACEKSEKSEISPWLATGTPDYLLVDDADGLQTVLQALDESEVVGLDTETTGLDPGATASASCGSQPTADCTWWTASRSIPTRCSRR
jgi:hypothetical protein